MKRIKELFTKKNKGVLNIYCTAGYPQLDSTLEMMKALQANGADIIELGMPYSDPIADGEVIQQSSAIALENGMSISVLFEQLEGMRDAIKVPVILMGYMNPVLQYGFEEFCKKASEFGVDGLIIPDLPITEFENEYGPVIKKYGLDFIFLVTPETKEERVRKIDALSSGFLYAVSSSSTTGKETNLQTQIPYFERLQQMNLTNPVLVGFGIKDKQSFEMAATYTNGAIIGSAYIKAIQNSSDIETDTKVFLEAILK